MNGDDRDWKQDKLLTSHEVAKPKQSGIDIHELKGGRNASKLDLYKDENSNIYIKPKGGNSSGDPTGLNLDDF
ncbi:polymorphic toxin type 33 domain-containing protein [Phormidesmis priestleyi]